MCNFGSALHKAQTTTTTTTTTGSRNDMIETYRRPCNGMLPSNPDSLCNSDAGADAVAIATK